MSRSVFNKEGGAAAAGPHPRRPVTPASGDYRYRQEIPSLWSPPPSTTRTAAAPKLTLLTVGGRGAGHRYRPRQRVHLSGPRGRLGLRRSIGPIWSCLDNAVTESLFTALKVKLVDRQHHRTRGPPASPHPCRSASLDFPLRWRACNRSSAGTLGSFGGGRTVTDPSAPRGRPPLETASAHVGSQRSGRPCWGQAAMSRASMVAAAC
jgi:hypothetical protein